MPHAANDPVSYWKKLVQRLPGERAVAANYCTASLQSRKSFSSGIGAEIRASLCPSYFRKGLLLFPPLSIPCTSTCKTHLPTTADHYTWGNNCDGWHLVRTPDLSIIEELMLPDTSETRRLNTALDMLSTKREKNPPKKHGNIPL